MVRREFNSRLSGDGLGALGGRFALPAILIISAFRDFLAFDNLPLIETAEVDFLDSRDNSLAPAPGSAVGDGHHVDRAGHRAGDAG